ncbi:alpha/beta hydrolase [Undibacterium sp.]|uniref:alpha/beta hydrolase n=1 Tax=Undibacterium sp. TaxID=1914977 RepID=UPI00374DB406
MAITGGYLEAQLPAGIRSRFVNNNNGLDMHVLEAGHETPGRPVLLLLHGFPELAYSWRKIMLPLAAAGYHVVAPDQRGYGRTTGWDGSYDGDLAAYRMLNLVTDIVGLLSALGIRSVAAVAGHDFGSPVAGYCALMRPDMFPALALLGAPFGSVPSFPFDSASRPASGAKAAGSAKPPTASIHDELAALTPPRMHYQWYYSTRAAENDMLHSPQGLHDFLRAYYHVKSADFKANQPHPLAAWSAAELAKLPTYYVMEKEKTMPETVAPDMPSAAAITACNWLTDEELQVYAEEFSRTGFQGALQWYRCLTEAKLMADLRLFSGRALEVPTCFIAGASDWGIHQKPGELANMQQAMGERLLGCHLLEGAGHWVQQEQPEEVARLLLAFLCSCAAYEA